MATIKEVAQRAQVAISTVSNIINRSKYVSPEVTARVQAAIIELNYKADPIARNMKAARSQMIGIVVTDSSRIFFPPVIKSAQAVAAKENYQVMILDSNDSRAQEETYVNMMTQSRFDGIILDSVAGFEDAAYFHHLANLSYRNKRIPVVSIERNLEPYGIDSVISDNYLGAKDAVRHLISCGCKRVMHIAGPANSSMAEDRLRGYRDALKDAGIEPANRWIGFGDFSLPGGYEVMKLFLENGQAEGIDALFVSNDQMAIGALKALREAGLDVPARIRVVGFDDTFVASIIDPQLTTMHVSGKQIGTQAMGLLIQRLNHPGLEPQLIKLDVRLVVRKSTDPGAVEKWDVRT